MHRTPAGRPGLKVVGLLYFRPMNYSASLDRTSQLITGFSALLFAGITGFNLYLLASRDGWPIIILLGTTLLLIGIFLYCYLFRITSYRVSREDVVICRPAGERRIPIAEIAEVVIPTRESLRWTLRTFGNGGIFGYTGKFANLTYGAMTWYATRTDKTILLILNDNTKVLLSPDDLQLADEIRKTMRAQPKPLTGR